MKKPFLQAMIFALKFYRWDLNRGNFRDTPMHESNAWKNMYETKM